jgi:hypothetical protein
MHPTEIDEVALAAVVTVIVALPAAVPTVRLPFIEVAPAAVVVALPPTQRGPARETAPVVEAVVSVVKAETFKVEDSTVAPATVKVPPLVVVILPAVVMLVPMVVAASASETTRNTDTTTAATIEIGPTKFDNEETLDIQ